MDFQTLSSTLRPFVGILMIVSAILVFIAFMIWRVNPDRHQLINRKFLATGIIMFFVCSDLIYLMIG